jgi:hypothetical protein
MDIEPQGSARRRRRGGCSPIHRNVWWAKIRISGRYYFGDYRRFIRRHHPAHLGTP